jgi:hypothetical protein
VSRFSDLVSGGVDPIVLDTFGDEITFQPRTGTAYTMTAVLDSGDQVQQSQRVYQTAWAPLSSFTGGEPAKGDSVVIDGRTFRVADIDPEYLGGRLLKLALANNA